MITPTWVEVGTREELQQRIDADVHLELGWHESSTFTTYVQDAGNFKLRMFYWYRTGIRAELAVFLGMPVYKVQKFYRVNKHTHRS